MPRPERRSPRLRQFDYASPGAYFVTICSGGRRCVFGTVEGARVGLSPLGLLVTDAWRDVPRRWPGVELDAFVLMPNHLHGIIWLGRAGQAPPLHHVIGAFKAAVSRRAGRRVWQRSFHDRVIRNDEELDALRRYVEENPLRWELDCENPDRTRS